jgi:hypothetical protein
VVSFFSTDAPTAYDVILSWILTPAMEPVELYVP